MKKFSFFILSLTVLFTVSVAQSTAVASESVPLVSDITTVLGQQYYRQRISGQNDAAKKLAAKMGSAMAKITDLQPSELAQILNTINNKIGQTNLLMAYLEKSSKTDLADAIEILNSIESMVYAQKKPSSLSQSVYSLPEARSLFRFAKKIFAFNKMMVTSFTESAERVGLQGWATNSFYEIFNDTGLLSIDADSEKKIARLVKRATDFSVKKAEALAESFEHAGLFRLAQTIRESK